MSDVPELLEGKKGHLKAPLDVLVVSFFFFLGEQALRFLQGSFTWVFSRKLLIHLNVRWGPQCLKYTMRI